MDQVTNVIIESGMKRKETGEEADATRVYKLIGIALLCFALFYCCQAITYDRCPCMRGYDERKDPEKARVYFWSSSLVDILYEGVICQWTKRIEIRNSALRALTKKKCCSQLESHKIYERCITDCRPAFLLLRAPGASVGTCVRLMTSDM